MGFTGGNRGNRVVGRWDGEGEEQNHGWQNHEGWTNKGENAQAERVSLAGGSGRIECDGTSRGYRQKNGGRKMGKGVNSEPPKDYMSGGLLNRITCLPWSRCFSSGV